MQLIGIAGRAGSGKDTIAKWLGVMHCAFLDTFAFPIKQTLIGMFPGLLTWDHFNNRDLKEVVIPEIGRSPRELAQLLGTEFGRRVNSDLWIIMLDRRRHEYWPGGFRGYYVIHDMRFENEAVWVRKNGGIVIHVTRQGVAGVAEHASEAGIIIETGDLLIANDGTVEQLHEKLAGLFPARAVA